MGLTCVPRDPNVLTPVREKCISMLTETFFFLVLKQILKKKHLLGL